MRDTTLHICKDKVHQLTVDGQVYCSQHSIELNGALITLAVEKAAGKPESTRGSRFFNENTKPNAAIVEAKTRYPKHGGTSIVKAALVLNKMNEVIEKVALKCFFSYPNADMSPIIAGAEKEAAYWHGRGQEAYLFTRYHHEMRGKVYLVMPWINGYDLQQLCEHHAADFNIHDRVNMLSQAFETLLSFHQKGEIVSDLRLENIMYNTDTKKICFIDVAAMPYGSEVQGAFSPNYVESPKRLAYQHNGTRPVLDEKDALYAFGRVAGGLLSSPYASPEDTELAFRLIQEIRQSFCNPDRNARRFEFSLQEILNNLKVVYSHNPYERVKVRFYRVVTRSPEEAPGSTVSMVI
jgi:serine/threonine protein kinase